MCHDEPVRYPLSFLLCLFSSASSFISFYQLLVWTLSLTDIFIFRFSETIKSNVALNSNMFETPLATVRYGSSSGSVELSFFIECVLHTEQLEKVLADIRRAREPVLKKGPRDGYNSFNDIVPELRRDLEEFIATLPEEPRWGTSGLPSDCGHLVGFESQKTFSNAR